MGYILMSKYFVGQVTQSSLLTSKKLGIGTSITDTDRDNIYLKKHYSYSRLTITIPIDTDH